MAAEGCPKEGGNSKPNPPATLKPFKPGNPNPNPDTKAKTPDPGAADPGPGECHVVSLFATWAPIAEFVDIEWEIGNDDGTEKQKTGGEWDKTKTVCGDASALVKVQWTSISKKNMIKKGTNGQLTATVLIDGHALGPNHTMVRFGPNAVAFASYDP